MFGLDRERISLQTQSSGIYSLVLGMQMDRRQVSYAGVACYTLRLNQWRPDSEDGDSRT